MTAQNLIRVIKRAERERTGREDAGCANSEPSAREKSRDLAATVRLWIGESRQTRAARDEEGKQQLGWPEVLGHSPESVGASAEGEE